ncbi:MAG: triose-phosphate isomerase [Gammaproteobacteria bacterium]|nr:MAG: triose-phosphate isomerase [Gammaproteobacteria bacterium]
MRKPVVAGNWKMNGTRSSVDELMSGIKSQLTDSKAVDVIVCPPAIFIPQALSSAEGTCLQVGAQNAASTEKGAFTGEISPMFLADFGCSHVILGHSERRQLFAETSEQVAAKFELAQSCSLVPVLCVGETQEQREQSETFNVVSEQLLAVIDRVGVQAFSNAIVAYEPVWAIGTGLTATPEQAQQVHHDIRELFAQKDQQVADQLRILYGGSVKASNAKTLFECPDIDGGLIGGASLDATEFVAICQAAL